MSHEAKWGGGGGALEAALESQMNISVSPDRLGRAVCSRAPGDIKHCSGCISMSFFCDTLMPTNVWHPHLVGSALSCSCSTGDPVWLGSFHPTLSLSPPSSRSVPLVAFPRSLRVITWQVFHPFTIKKTTLAVSGYSDVICGFLGGFQSFAVLQYAGENFPEGFVK